MEIWGTRGLGLWGLGFFRGKERIGPRVFDDVFYFIFFYKLSLTMLEHGFCVEKSILINFITIKDYIHIFIINEFDFYVECAR